MPHNVLHGDQSDLECEQTSVSSPLTTLTWYRQEPGDIPQPVNSQSDVNITESVRLDHIYSWQDQDVTFYCNATQPESIHSQPVQSNAVTVNVNGKLLLTALIMHQIKKYRLHQRTLNTAQHTLNTAQCTLNTKVDIAKERLIENISAIAEVQCTMIKDYQAHNEFPNME